MLEEMRAQLTEAAQAVLNTIWNYRIEKDKWISSAWLQYQLGKNRNTLHSGLRNLNGCIVRENKGDYNYWQMTLLGVLFTHQGREYEKMLEGYLRYIKGKLESGLEPKEIKIRSQEIKTLLNLSDEQLQIFNAVLQTAQLTSGGGGNKNEWETYVPYYLNDLLLEDDLSAYIERYAFKDYDQNLPVSYDERTRHHSNERNQLYSFANPFDLTHKEDVTPNPETKDSLDIFISHSSQDRNIAARLIELLRNALNIPADRIRCTSVDGYRLKVGIDTNKQLRQEVHDAHVFIGLITPTSIASAYVMFELGARWGATRFLAPLLVSEQYIKLLQGPISGLNALRCDSREQMLQLVEDIGEELNINVKNLASYSQYIDALVRECEVWQQTIANPIQSQTEQSNIVDYDDNDIIALLGTYIRAKQNSYERFVIRFSDAENELSLMAGAAEKHIETSARHNGFTILRKGKNTIELQYPYPTPAVGGSIPRLSGF